MLDILTERGQVSARDELVVAGWVSSQGGEYCVTPKAGPARVDAVICRGGAITAVVETKCRYDMDVKKFRCEYRSEWLITDQKVQDGREAAVLLGVPFLGVLYIVPSRVILVVTIADNRGVVRCSVRVAQTETQETINGGRVSRRNAFVSMLQAKEWRV